MPLKIGSTDVDDVKLGGSQVEAIYQGTNEVWSAVKPAPTVVGSLGFFASVSGTPIVCDWSSLGQQAGDIVVISVNQGPSIISAGVGLTDLSGVTTVFSGPVTDVYTYNESIYWGRASEVGTSKSAHVSANVSNTGQWTIVSVTVLRGVDNASPLDIPYALGKKVQTVAATEAPIWDAPAVTPVTPNALILGVWGLGQAQLTTEINYGTDTSLVESFYTDANPQPLNKDGRAGGHILVPNGGGTVQPFDIFRTQRPNLERFLTGYFTLAFRAG